MIKETFGRNDKNTKSKEAITPRAYKSPRRPGETGNRETEDEPETVPTEAP